MKLVVLALLTLSMAAGSFGLHPRDGAALGRPLADAEEAAVREAVSHYLRGHATGDPEEFRKAFHAEMRMQWVRDGQLAQRTAAEYIAGASGQAAADEARRRRQITTVDVTGDAAMAKVVLDYPQALITDYLSLLRVDGEWKVVAKTFHVQPRSQP